MIKTFTFSLAATALLLAETTGYESIKTVASLDTIDVEAPKLKTKELTSTAAVEVYTADEIKASKSKDLGEYLNAYTSAVVQSGFGNNFSPKIELRGFGLDNGNQNVVVVVDGRRLNNIDSASQFLSAIPIESISKIEILKGTGSVEYGDNATAGVISITTKPYDGVQFQTYAGNYGTSYGSIGAGFNGEKLSLSVFGDRFNQDGIRIINLAGDTDKQELTNGHIDAAYYVSDTLELRVNALDSDGSIFYAPAQTLAEYENDTQLLGTAGSGNHSYQAIEDRVL
ncbi:MAG: TonB-dependent receptor, partial [Sulfurimonadaceae bacterium]|nr:TonB-dependent receptor [Sulfurimonadaceae bacterium]